MKLRLGALAAVLATTGLATPAVPLATAPAVADEVNGPILELTAPKRVVVQSYDGSVYGLGMRLQAPNQALEIRSHRPTWSSAISTVWRSPDGDVALPAGVQTRWEGLDKFLRVTITRLATRKVVSNRRYSVCLNSWDSQRTTPEAPLRSPYPQGCPYNPYTIGSVQGIQQGWASSLDESLGGFALKPGRYQVKAFITPAWVKALKLPSTATTREFRLVVQKAQSEERHRRAADAHRGVTDYGQPAARAPKADAAGAPAGPQPDLRSLPAFGMQLSPNSKYLRFSATVWNAGNSPMVVDGFRRPGKDLMDAYQYFIDADGNQTGYRKVGTMIWHTAPTHNHWHFEDFARYRLLRADKTQAVRSRKESFCLANTDAVDYTVEGADWRPENTDLHTACGDHGSLSLREVLASGSGDTYAQFRAGQAFRIDNLPNGIYYVSVEGNPQRNLVESDTTNNEALRKIKLSGTPKHRKLKVFQVGVIQDDMVTEAH